MALTKPMLDLIIDSMLDIWCDESTWTKGAEARRIDGSDVTADNWYAISWCAIGCKSKALSQLKLYDYDTEFEDFMDYHARKEFNVSSIVEYNDRQDTTFEDMRLFVKCLKDKDPIEVEPCSCPYCVDERRKDQECIDSL